MEQGTQDYVESSGTGVMVCNLPLLFTRGYPSSLQHMKLDELEDFVPFMVRCSLGEENPVPWSQLPRPAWWPRKLPFRIPSGSTPTAKMTALVDLVHRCYSFHGCDYLLQFCASLLEDMPRTGHRFNDNRDGTTSMYHGTTGKLLVTFRNENRDYDKSNHDTSLRKKLLLSPTRVSSSGTTTAVFQPAATDIYLCDKCENEFYSLREVQIHEKKCCGDTPPSPLPHSPDPEPADEDLEPAGQVPFLAYFRLQPAKHTGMEPYMSPRKRSSSPPRKLIGSMFPRFESIPLTSPLGKFLLTNSKLRNKYQASQHLVIRYERHLHATPHTDIVSSRDRCNNRWIVVWRPHKEQQPWCHLYCFTKRQKRERHLTIESGLNWKSRKLLSRCRPVSVVVKRLQKRIVDRVTRLNGPTAPCIDLTDEPQRMFSEMLYNYPETILSSSASFDIKLNGTPKSDDPLRLFYDSSETTLNFGASSSSSHPPAVPVTVGSRHVGIAQQYNNWGNEVESPEQDPLAFNPGDIINHDTISILPITPSNLLQNHSSLNTSGNVNHSTQRQPNSHYKGLSLKGVPAPGPKCSKINRDTLSKRQHVQQTGNTYTLSNSDLLQLTQRNYGVLGKFHTNTSEISVSANTLSGHSVSSNLPQTLNRCQENPTRTSVKNSVPRLHENNSLVLSHTTGATTPSINSLIEVIDLSSDDDDSGRIKIYSEADHAPSQLDGLSCYSHSGAKMPGSSSKSSLPKNGNSHWSSNCKSHCDAGRVGDLATNGQPPNVLKNPASVSQGFNSRKVSLSSIQPDDKVTINSRKRRCEDHPPDYVGRKLVVLDVSNVGMKVVSCENLTEDDIIAISRRPLHCEKTLTHPVATPSDRERDVRRHHGIQSISGEVDDLSGLNQSGAFVRSVISQPEFSYTEPSNQEKSLLRERKCNDNLSKRKNKELNAQKLALETEKLSGSLFKNLVSTVSKGVEFICSLVGSGSVNELKSGNEDRMESNSRHSSELMYFDDTASKSEVLDSSLKDQVVGGDKFTKVPKEVKQLLKDECRELNRNGLRDLRSIDVQTCKLTRRSVERTIPRRAHRRQKLGKEVCNSFQKDTEDFIIQDNMSECSTALSVSSKSSDVLLNYMDENGNSPSYSKTKLNKEAQYDLIVDKATPYGPYSSQVDVSNKNNNNSNNDKDDVNSNNNIVGQFVSGRKDQTFTDHYRGVTNASLINRSRLQGSECNISVHNTPGETGDSVIKSMAYVGRKEPFELMVMGESGLTLDKVVFGSESSPRNELKRGNYNEVEIRSVTKTSAEHHKETGDPDCPSSLARELLPHDKTMLSCSSGSHELTLAKRDPPVIVCSSKSPLLIKALQNQVPLSERLVGSNDKGKVAHLYHGSNTCNEKTDANIFELDSRRKASSIARKKVPISLQDTSILCHPVSSLSKLNSPSSTSDEVDNVENMPFHSSVLSINRKSKEKRSRVSVESGLNVGDELQTSVGGNRPSYGFTASESNSSHDKTSKDETISSQSRSINGIRQKRSLLRELNNLAKDEWKEMQLRGFHPSSFLDLSSEQRCSSEESENELESDDSEMLNKKSINLKEDFRKDTIRTTPKKLTLSRELLRLSKDEWKEVHGTGFHPSEMILAENNQGLEGDDPDLHERSDPEASEEMQDSLVGGNRLEEINSKDESGENETSRKRKKVAIPRELINLGKDEWKEMQNTGFHPSDLVGSRGDKVTYFYGESEGEENDTDSTENDPPHKTFDNVQKKEAEKKKKISRELSFLLRDECKELKRKRKGANELRVNRRQRREIGGVDRYPNSVDVSTNSDSKTGKEQKANKYATARNTRSQTNVVSLVEVFTPRDSHRQLLHTETGMCVLNFNLPMIS